MFISESHFGGCGCRLKSQKTEECVLGFEECSWATVAPFAVHKLPACHNCFKHLLPFSELVKVLSGQLSLEGTEIPEGRRECMWCLFRLCADCANESALKVHAVLCPRGESSRLKLTTELRKLGTRVSESIPMAASVSAAVSLRAEELGLSPDVCFEEYYNSDKYFGSHECDTYQDNGYQIVANLLHQLPMISETLYNKIVATFDRTNLFIEVENFSMMSDLNHPIPGLDQLKHMASEFSAILPSNPDDFPIPVVVGSAHYPTVARLNHSCDPNLDWRSVNGSNTIELYTLRDISAGEELFISYIDQSLPKPDRQALLKSLYGFNCRCLKCENE